MNPELSGTVRQFARSEECRIIFDILQSLMKSEEQNLCSFSVSQDNEKDFLIRKHQLDGARLFVMKFKGSIERLGASDSSGESKKKRR